MSATLQRPPASEPATPFRRPTWQEAVASYLPERHRARGERWATHLPVVLFGVLGALLALRLGRPAFIDEALYINAGQDYINHWRFGSPLPDHVRAFSGSPILYPVLAALLDAVGGLRLVRGFSLVLMFVSTLSIAGATRALFGFRAGVFAAGAFALTGPVIFVGALATFDALCMTLLALALWAGLTGRGWPSAVLVGVLLGIAPMVKYAGIVFLPPVLGVIALGSVRGMRRATVAAAVSGAALAAAWWLVVDDRIREGIAFTTSAREALSPASTEFLLWLLLADIGVVAAVGVVGAMLAWRRPGRLSVAMLGMLGAAALLPAAGLRLGEAVSFDKHTAYSALFLAPLVGVALDAWSRRTYRLGPPLALLALVLAVGGIRSGMLHGEWVDVTPVVERIEADPRPGVYLSSSADVLEYYTRHGRLDIAWETSFELYAYGADTIRQVIEDGRYTTVILRAATTTNPSQDAGQALLLDALRSSPHYRALRPLPIDEWSDDAWLIFQRRLPADGPRPTADGPSTAAPPAVAPPSDEVPDSGPRGTTADQQGTEAAPDEAAVLLDGLRRGDRGPRVGRWQEYLQRWDADALPRHGVDGVFGRETEEWTERYLAG